MPQEPSLRLTTVTLTDRERAVIHNALKLSSTILAGLDDFTGAADTLDLAFRLHPDGIEP